MKQKDIFVNFVTLSLINRFKNDIIIYNEIFLRKGVIKMYQTIKYEVKNGIGYISIDLKPLMLSTRQF